MTFIIGLFFLQIIKTVELEEIVDTTVILRKRITLDCTYSGNETIVQCSWAKFNGSFQEQLCAMHKTYGKHISEKYKGRMSFAVNNSSSDISITLTETSEEDIGIYFCYIALFPLGTVKKVVAVQAADFGQIMPTSHQTFIENSSITLNFQYTLGADVRKVTLERFTDLKMDTIASCEQQINKRKEAIYGFDFIKRSFLNCTNLHNINLIIHQTASTDEGLYRCHFNSGDQNQTIVVNMQLKKGITPLLTVVLMYGGSLVIIITLVFTATICIIRKWKHKRKQTLPSTTTLSSTDNHGYQPKSDRMYEDKHIYANIALPKPSRKR